MTARRDFNKQPNVPIITESPQSLTHHYEAGTNKDTRGNIHSLIDGRNEAGTRARKHRLLGESGWERTGEKTASRTCSAGIKLGKVVFMVLMMLRQHASARLLSAVWRDEEEVGITPCEGRMREMDEVKR